MFQKLKMKIAAHRVQRSKSKKSVRRAPARKTARKSVFWSRVRAIIAWPFRMIGRALRRVWSWICAIDLIGLINLTLLFAIIVLAALFIIDVVNCRRAPKIVIAQQPVVAQTVHATPAPSARRTPVKQVASLPVKRDASRKYVAQPVNVVAAKPCGVCVRQTARTADTMYGDVIIDSRGAAKMLRNGDKIRGNLYLQNMRKYTLPCGVRIEGNLFLRDVNMVQFCGEFTVTGNIYVSPKSSFGPIPRTARLGGQVIL